MYYLRSWPKLLHKGLIFSLSRSNRCHRTESGGTDHRREPLVVSRWPNVHGLIFLTLDRGYFRLHGFRLPYRLPVTVCTNRTYFLLVWNSDFALFYRGVLHYSGRVRHTWEQENPTFTKSGSRVRIRIHRLVFSFWRSCSDGSGC